MKLIYTEAVYWLILAFSCKQFQLKGPSTEKLKLKHFDGVLNLLILWNSENMWFCVCEDKSYTVATIMTKHVNIFC